MTLSRAVIVRWCTRYERALLAALLLLGLLMRLPLLPVDTRTTADLAAFRTWARMVHAQGITTIYDGTRINYPPVLLYAFDAGGQVEAYLPAASRAGDAILTALIKLPSVLADILTAWLIAFWVRQRQSAVLGVLACGLYLFNPAIWYVSAHWGQADSVYTLFLIASLVALARGGLFPAWIAYTLALGTKMQSIAIAPLLFTVTLVKHGIRGLAGGVAIGILVAAVLTAPWLITGRIANVLQASFTLPTRIPQVDVSGYNLWYLLLGGDIRGVGSELYPPNLPLSYQQIAVAMFGALVLLVVRLVWRQRARAPAVPAAVLSMGLFMLLTEIHERYMFPVLAFLLMSTAEHQFTGLEAISWRRHLRWVYGVLSLTFLFNLVTIAVPTPILGTSLVTIQPPYTVGESVLKGLALLAAVVNMLALAWLILNLVRDSFDSPQVLHEPE